MKMKYANYFIQNMRLGDPTPCVYQLFFDENGSNETNIIQYFIMHDLGLCTKINIVLAHMFYTWSFSHNAAVLISIIHNPCYLSLHAYTTVFAWEYGYANRIRT